MALEGDADDAIRLSAAAARLRRRSAHGRRPRSAAAVEAMLAHAYEALSPAAAARARGLGETLTVERAIEEALALAPG